MNRYLALLLCAFFAVVAGARGEGPDDQYVRVYNLIQEGDALTSNGQSTQATAKYSEAQTGLQHLKTAYPDWNTKVVAYRLNYVAAKIAASTPRIATGATPRGTNAAPVAVRPGPAPAPDAQLAGLRDQVRQLQSDKILLEAKLKEAFTAQPAQADPREIARAQEKLRTSQKENELLKTTLAQEKSRKAPDNKVAQQQSQVALTEANRRLLEQTERANSLAQEKKLLQDKMQGLIPGNWNSNQLDQTRRELAQANARLAQQTQMAARLAQEKQSLEAQLHSTAPNVEELSSLRAENQILKQQLAQARTTPAGKSKTDDTSRQLALARAEIASLQSDKQLLRLEKIALENRVKQLSSPAMLASRGNSAFAPATALPAPPAGGRPEDLTRIKQLENERDDLLRRLEMANKDTFGRRNLATAARIEEMQNQIATLRARLEVFEARQVPYSVEELALFRKPEPRLANTTTNSGRKSVKELPAGSASLVAEAHAYFSANRLDKAEDKYQEILRKDEKNAPALANLAAIQLERNHLPEAERSINQAIAIAPEDAYNLSILGQVKFREQKYEDALDVLGRAARLDPKSAEIQNYLGITLSQKGLRGPAEAALRKAVQLEPGYASAHHNLAVVYASQQPPLIELARWHYQKSLAAGNPHNAELEKLFETKKLAESAH